jgi:hypothetical protein
MKFLHSILWHFLGIGLRSLQESQEMLRLRSYYRKDSNPKPVKYESDFLTSAHSSQSLQTLFTSKFKEDKNVLRH